jgi:hypothetical protein
MTFIIAQVIFGIAALINIVAIQRKHKENILFMFSFSTLLCAVAFYLLEADSGALACLIMSIFTVICFVIDKKKKKVPIGLATIFVLAIILANVFTVQGILDVLPVFASVLYVIGIVQVKEKMIRVLTFSNLILWIIYDCAMGAYTAILADGFFAISNGIAILRFDIVSKLLNKTGAHDKT